MHSTVIVSQTPLSLSPYVRKRRVPNESHTSDQPAADGPEIRCNSLPVLTRRPNSCSFVLTATMPTDDAFQTTKFRRLRVIYPQSLFLNVLAALPTKSPYFLLDKSTLTPNSPYSKPYKTSLDIQLHIHLFLIPNSLFHPSFPFRYYRLRDQDHSTPI
ncbi:hypothetical protein BT96DRAFT_1001240 [Gymnopus androsaceus JB14]|uniref:Uncharacterized protein n=1 Tax=Gymnopus androsaceus JB14 TaxID=1447944 RepID=A0A6A4H1F9_9AGAR|nr:hypothetical protein BT96DRAFT_1001240 [Gymnopus androsaceus JB14]